MQKILDRLHPPAYAGGFALEYKQQGKEQKAQHAERGGIIVQRSIVTITGNTVEHTKILLATRGEQHAITTGGSVLLSGSPEQEPLQVLTNKVTFQDHQPNFTIKPLGLGLSDPEQTNGIWYVFDSYIASTREELGAVSHAKGDTLQLATIAEATLATRDKKLEQAALSRLQEILTV